MVLSNAFGITRRAKIPCPTVNVGLGGNKGHSVDCGLAAVRRRKRPSHPVFRDLSDRPAGDVHRNVVSARHTSAVAVAVLAITVMIDWPGRKAIGAPRAAVVTLMS
jgi:hypothetical protein